MKRLQLTILLFLSLFTNVFAQAELLEDVVISFKTADHRLLAKHFTSKVEINLMDQSNVYSKSQAEMVMKDFFGKFDPRDFQILYKNTPSSEQVKFTIGQLETSAGRFRIFFILKQVDGNLLIQEMRFEQERK